MPKTANPAPQRDPEDQTTLYKTRLKAPTKESINDEVEYAEAQPVDMVVPVSAKQPIKPTTFKPRNA